MASEISRRLAAGGWRNYRQHHGEPTNRLAAGPTVRPAFTLVEMLVVITIIGILVSLGTVAVFKALEAAKRARIKVEITNLASAIESYKQKFGDYPPSYIDAGDNNSANPNSSVGQVTRHLMKAFPRCDVAKELTFLPSSKMTPAETLVFWLTSISKDPARPLSAPTTDRNVLFDFDRTRLVVSATAKFPQQPGGWSVVGGIPVYNSQVYVDQSGKNSPFVYFEARGYLGHSIQGPSSLLTAGIKGCYPYLLEPWDVNKNNLLDADKNGPPSKDVQTDSSGNWLPSSFQKVCANPKSFQIISAGLDGIFGDPPTTTATSATYNGKNAAVYYKSFPTGLGYDVTGGDDDNLTNFSEGALGDAKP